MCAVQVAAQALQYCLSDLGQERDGLDNDKGGAREEELEGLPLLVLGDGSIASLRRKSLSSRVEHQRDPVEDIFVVTHAERELFQRNAGCLVVWEVNLRLFPKPLLLLKKALPLLKREALSPSSLRRLSRPPCMRARSPPVAPVCGCTHATSAPASCWLAGPSL